MTDTLKTDFIKRMELLYQFQIYDTVKFKDFDDLLAEEQLNFMEIIHKLGEIDQIITNNLTNYTLDRLNKVDLAIIRITVYELLLKRFPAEVMINLGIELTKEFSDLDDEKQHKFTNKLLDTIYKNIK